MFSISTLTASAAVILTVSAHRSCRCFPGDDCWPSEDVWQDFNRTLDGQLVVTLPLAAPCHDSTFAAYNATQCELLQNAWIFPEAHYNSSSSVMAPFFANQSCDPFSGEDAQCVVGSYISYAVDVRAPAHASAALHFARRHNIRVVIRNTGHDYNGKSTGAGSLGIWTHHLKDISIFDYQDSRYNGKAMKMGAGVQGFQAYAAAYEQNLVVVGGECPTVGLAGGYTQGGGHSALASMYGLSADQALEWDVITATGVRLTATRDQYSDLFWALSGGGGGTYGVVLSLTVKAHPEMPTSGANLTFTSQDVSQDVYWSAIEYYHQMLPSFVDQGAMCLCFYTNSTFSIAPITAPGINAARLNDLLGPFFAKLEDLNINYTKTIRQFPSYFEHFYAMFAPITVGVAQYGGRLVPRSVVQNNNSALTSAYRSIADNGGNVTIVALNVTKAVAGDVYNSVNPVWRETLLDTVITTPWNFTAPWSEMMANADKMTNEFIPALEQVTPGAGTYLNEGDFQDPNWKENYYGVNYGRLLAIKNKYDPEHLFYALTAVDSDFWEPQPDGRLCQSRSYGN